MIPLLRPTLVLTVEPSLGHGVHDVAAEMCRLSKQLNVEVRCTVNGVKLVARPGTDPEKLAASYFNPKLGT